jgi:hypothetical protein
VRMVNFKLQTSLIKHGRIVYILQSELMNKKGKRKWSASSSAILIYLSIYLWLYSPLLGLQFLYSYTQSVGLLGRGISPSQGRYIHTEQHKHRINAHNTDIHALSGIRTHNPSVRASEDSSCLRPRSHCDWRPAILGCKKIS